MKEKNSDIILSEADFLGWQQKAHELQQQIGALNGQLMMLNKKMEAYTILMSERHPNSAPQNHFTFSINLPGPVRATRTSQPLSDQIMAALADGSKKNNQQIKAFLKTNGAELGKNDAYYYTTVSRLVKNTNLSKKGNTTLKLA